MLRDIDTPDTCVIWVRDSDSVRDRVKVSVNVCGFGYSYG